MVTGFYLAVLFVISALVLAYELLLMRLFSITHFHHFAPLVISTALLGFGVSGSFGAIFQSFFQKYFFRILNFGLYGLALSFLLGVALSQTLEINFFFLFWLPRLWWRLVCFYVLLLIPFLVGAQLIVLFFMQFRHKIHWLYAANLSGSAFGALFIVMGMFWAAPEFLLKLLSLLCVALILIMPYPSRKEHLLQLGGGLLLSLFIVFFPVQLEISEYKELAHFLKLSDTEILYQRYSPECALHVVKSPSLHLSPGQSLNYTASLPPQYAIFFDSSSPTAISSFTDLSQMQYLDYSTQALAYALLAQKKRLLLMGAGGGTQIALGLYHQMEQIIALERNNQVIQLMQHELAEFSNHIYLQPQVKVLHTEARHFLFSSSETFDLIQVPLTGGESYSLNENYLYTKEGLVSMMQHLAPTGILSISQWMKFPPKENKKMFASLVEAAETFGSKALSLHFVLIKGWNSTTLLFGKSIFSTEQIVRVKQFCQQRHFDLLYYPGIQREEMHQFHSAGAHQIQLEDLSALLSPVERTHYYERSRFFLTPATDDRPFFHYYFKLKTWPLVLKGFRHHSIFLGDITPLILPLTCLQLFFLSGLGIFLPLLFLKKLPARQRLAPFFYFMSLGMSYMFVEMAFIQKFILYLGPPIYSMSFVITGFLFFSGLGSLWAVRFPAWVPFFGIIAFALIYLFWLDTLFVMASFTSLFLRGGFAFFVLFPLAFFMGMPFPRGLQQIEKMEPDFLPWCWGVNGFFSVISTSVATFLAVYLGFSAVLVFALLLYLLAGLLYNRFS